MMEDITFWQKLYLVGIVVGVTVFIEIIGRITDEVRIEYKGFFTDCRKAISSDWANTKKILRGRS